jgi:hypothetical protein
VRWDTPDGEHAEELTILWENEGWTASGLVAHERIQYVLRLNASWHVRQLLLFRDLDEPDLWLATDGSARWGEMNGAHRPDLDGCYDLDLPCTPFTRSLPIRRLPLHVGDTADITVAVVDVETLGVVPQRQRYTRLDTHRWAFSRLDEGGDHDEGGDDGGDGPTAAAVEFDVDPFGLAVDLPRRRRAG